VALLTAVDPPAGVDLVREIADRGLVLETTVGDDAEPALRRLAAARAKEREVALDPAALERLLVRTDSRAAAFAMELEKLLEWAGKGGRIRAADIESNVEDESSEDVYGLFDAIGRRDAGDALARLERLLDGRDVRAGERDFRKIEDIWPIQLFGMLAGEVRRMLLIRSRLDEAGTGFDASMSYQAFQARFLPRLMAPAVPFGRSPFETAQGGAHPFGLYRSAQRSSKFTTPQLARALARAADVDAALKNSGPPLELLTAYVGDLIAGR
jgi:DNA polymerase III delta subunit